MPRGVVEADRPVDEPLDWAQERVKRGSLAGKDSAHIAAQRRRHEKDGEQEKADFEASR
jgi:hypothetical protein